MEDSIYTPKGSHRRQRHTGAATENTDTEEQPWLHTPGQGQTRRDSLRGFGSLERLDPTQAMMAQLQADAPFPLRRNRLKPPHVFNHPDPYVHCPPPPFLFSAAATPFKRLPKSSGAASRPTPWRSSAGSKVGLP
jgi:hypothetical protein